MKNVVVKKNLIIFKNAGDWYKIREQMSQDFGRTNLIISWRCRREFGFSVREHRVLEQHSKENPGRLGDEWLWKYHYQNQIHLDFYSEAQMTWFQLKYLNT